LTPITPHNNSGLSADLFGDAPIPKYKRKLKAPKKKLDTGSNLKPLSEAEIISAQSGDMQIIEPGNTVQHDRFGKGKVVSLEGEPGNVKANINFETSGEKKLLLKFAKLRIIAN
ncbi:MAG: ATP-dependent DNA helicase, partial [Weeksellaceae bacterium]